MHQPTASVSEPASPAKVSHRGVKGSLRRRFSESKEEKLEQTAEVSLSDRFLARDRQKVADWESFEIPLYPRNIPLGLLTRRQSEGEIMTSAKKAQANRQNALKSTGPKTPEGKASVRHNALKHGLLAQEVLLPEEDEVALRELDER
jgi:hypothetical protein